MRKVMRCAAMMVVSLAVVLASFGLRPMEAKALPVLEDWTDVQAVSTALMAYMESAGMTIMVEADNWQTLASTMWETIADAYVFDVGAEAAGAATGAAWLASLAPQIALIGGGIVVGAAAGVGMFKLLDWLMDKYFPSGTGAGVELYSGTDGNVLVEGDYRSIPVYDSVWDANIFVRAPIVDVLDSSIGPVGYRFTVPSGFSFSVACKYDGVYKFAYWWQAPGSDSWKFAGTATNLRSPDFALSRGGGGNSYHLALAFPGGLYFVGGAPVFDRVFPSALPAFPAPSTVTASVPSAVSAPTIPTGSAMRIETGASSSATPEETLQHVGDQIINNTFSPTYTIVIDPSQDPVNPPSGEDSGILDWIKSIYYRLTQLATGLAESVSEAIQTALLPSEEFVQELPDRVKTTFADRTGFLTYPISVLVDFVGELGKYAEEDFIISWPDVAEPISGYTIMEAGSFNMSAMVRDNEAFQTIHDLWFLVAKGMMILAFLRLCVRKFNSVVGDRMVD